MSKHHARLGKKQQQAFRMAVLIRDEFTCAECGKAYGRLEAHHIVPLSENGSNHPSNGRCYCRDCHIRLHHPERDPGMIEWDKLLAKTLSR